MSASCLARITAIKKIIKNENISPGMKQNTDRDATFRLAWIKTWFQVRNFHFLVPGSKASFIYYLQTEKFIYKIAEITKGRRFYSKTHYRYMIYF
jgi:hypothetical protein